jgi:UDP-N-acetylglucosamine 2-epimerase (non-hydrolysing)/GDP/UDP-N,N'-diacetylbacillosamine 2-epimerase (hydrolysing)
LGENPKRIYVIGSIAIDKFITHQSIPIEKVAELFCLEKMFDKYALVIFHPLRLESEPDQIVFRNILDSLIQSNLPAFIGYPNSDPGNREIIKIAEEYSKNKQFVLFKSIDRDVFLTIYKNALFQIGNSSSGLMEAASIPIPAINVGQRQKGRKCNVNVIFCDTNVDEIKESIEKAISQEFLLKTSKVINIFGEGKSAKIAFKLIKEISFTKLFFKTEDPLNL